MTEKLLHYIWQFGYFNKNDLQTITGEKVEIFFRGNYNKNSGPDFLNAKIKVGTTLLAGSVELHIVTSDWDKHGHSRDANYNNVILHVVYQHDSPGNGAFPTLELSSLIPKILLQKWESLMLYSGFVPCAASITSVKEIIWLGWKERLLAERLTRKSLTITSYLEKNNFHWEETFWWLLARNFGIKVNSDAFEEIAQSLAITILAKHKTQIHHLEALLFGQANLLNASLNDSYARLLQQEYLFLKHKYNLKKVHLPIHFLRMRPGNFPTIRLAQLAVLLHQSEHLFSKVVEAQSSSEIKKLFSVTATDYWYYRYRFDEASPYKQKKIGSDMLDNIIINTVVPVLFSYGVYHNEEKHKLKALKWLEETANEKNSVVDGFTKLSITNRSAYDSQALLELKNEYCSPKRCLDCSIGAAILKKE